MDWRAGLRKVHSAEGAFCLAGLFFIGLAFVFDIAKHLATVAAEPGHEHGGGDVFLRVNIPAMGIAFLAFGMGMYLVEHHRSRLYLTAFVAGLLILTDGIAHLFAISDHVDIPLHAAVFIILAPAQIAGGLLFPFLPRKWDRYWIVLTVALIVVFGISRRIAVPPLWDLEEVEPVGVFSKIIELLTLFPLYTLVRGSPSTPPPATMPGAAEP